MELKEVSPRLLGIAATIGVVGYPREDLQQGFEILAQVVTQTAQKLDSHETAFVELSGRIGALEADLASLRAAVSEPAPTQPTTTEAA